MAKEYTYDMTKGNTTMLLLKFTIPMLIGNLFQQLYNMVDGIVVGNVVGSDALGAIGASSSISFFLFSLSFGLGAGIGVVISQYFGARDEAYIKKTIASSMYIILISAFITSVIGVLLADPILRLLKTPEDVLKDAVTYMQISCIGFMVVALYNGVSSILRALGDSKTPLFFLIAACLINIVLDILFVAGFKMGVAGAGWATIIAQALAGVGSFVFAWYKISYFRMPIKEYKPYKDVVIRCLKVGLPVALQNSMIAVSCIILQRVVNGFGKTILTAYTAECKVEQLVQQPFTSLGAAIATYTGQNMGAGDIERVKKGFWSGTWIIAIFSLLMLPVFWLGSDLIMKWFTNDAQVIAEGARGLRIVTCFYAALGMIYVTRNVLNGSGDANFAMLSGFIEVGGRVGFAGPLTSIPSIGVLGIWFTTGLTWVVTAAISCIRYAQGKWKTKAIVSEK